MQVQAITKNFPMSAQKVREVVRQIQGLSAVRAQAVLAVVPRKSARIVAKTLNSAIANAENRHNDVDVDQLLITEAYVNEGPRMKRVRPAPMGRAYRYQRRIAHIIVKVGDGKGKE